MIREAVPADAGNGLLESLDALRPTRDMDPAVAREALADMCGNPNHLVAVAVAGGRVVGTASLIVERKVLHGGGLAGHIEDVAVRKDLQRAGIGRRLVEYLLEAARSRGCYRTTLVCEPALVRFYEGIGLREYDVSMRIDHT